MRLLLNVYLKFFCMNSNILFHREFFLIMSQMKNRCVMQIK